MTRAGTVEVRLRQQTERNLSLSPAEVAGCLVFQPSEDCSTCSDSVGVLGAGRSIAALQGHVVWRIV